MQSRGKEAGFRQEGRWHVQIYKAGDHGWIYRAVQTDANR